MKKMLIFVVIALTLAACAPAAAVPAVPTAVSLATTLLPTDYADATSARNQLAYGTLKLEGTPQAISAEQARTLLPLWQAIVALSGSTTSSTEEITAIQNQILGELKPEQVQAITAMKITNTQLNAYYAENGIVISVDPSITKVPGSGKDVPTEVREATRAAAAASGTTSTGQMTKTFLFTKVIDLLTARSAK